MKKVSKLEQIIETGFAKQSIDQAERHVFLCSGPDCCAHGNESKTWETLKAGIKKLGIPALRSKADCLRICAGGPWMVIYPEGIWYGDVSSERCERILQEHLAEGRPIQEWIQRQHPLGRQANNNGAE
jgi:(2Fe-2S) ferredoxin